MVIKESIPKYKPITSKSYKQALKVLREKERVGIKAINCLWEKEKFSISFEDGSNVSHTGLSKDEVVQLLHKMYFTPGSLAYEARRELDKEKTLEWRKEKCLGLAWENGKNF